MQNNLPVRRELLYEVVPELFEREIGELEEYKRKLIMEGRPMIRAGDSSVLQVVERLPREERK